MRRPKRLRQKAYDYERGFRAPVHPIWLDGRVPAGFWMDPSNRKGYMIWLGRLLGYTGFEDWYCLTGTEVIRHRGRGLLVHYDNSTAALLKAVFPEYDWMEWLFVWAPKHFWEDKANWKRYVAWLGGQLGIKRDQQWLAVTQADFARHQGNGLVASSGSFRKVLRECLPHLDWDAHEKLTIRSILAWADEHHERTGRWPTKLVGNVAGTTWTWGTVDVCLRQGRKGLPGGTSLAELLAKKRGVRNQRAIVPLREDDVLRWADEHLRRTGRWPTSSDGPVVGHPDNDWQNINAALRIGRRGLPGGSSLAKFLALHRGKRTRTMLPRLSIAQILEWADHHFRSHGKWPRAKLRVTVNECGDRWDTIDAALRLGSRGLPAGMSLACLLHQHRGVPNLKARPKLTKSQILGWARAHRRRTGERPKIHSGPVAEAPGETWAAIAAALAQEGRGLKGRTTLFQLIAGRRRKK